MHKPSRRHHFIPRLLLRGFASKVVNGKYFVYQSRHGTDAREVSIADVGVERDFHGETAEIEARLSVKESQYAPVINDMREGRIPRNHDALIADLIVNLCIRPRNVRAGLAEAGTLMLDRIHNEAHDPRNYAAMEQELREETVKKVLANKKFRKHMKKRFGTQSDNVAERLARQAFDAFPISPGEMFQHFTHEVRSRIDVASTARDAQLKALGNDNALAWRKGLQRLSWSLSERAPGTFVLGDLGPIARRTGAPGLVSVLGPGDISAVYLPVSSSVLLSGRTRDSQEDIDADALNVAAVELSRDLFVASRNTQREREYVAVLGRRSQIVDQAMLERPLFNTSS